MTKRIEALVDAIGKLNGIHDPESEAYALKNPLLLKSFAKVGKHEVDPQGRRIFASILNGIKSSLFDVDLKVNCKSRANITETSTLENLLACYEIKSRGAVDNIVSFLKRALKDPNINASTPITYFQESQ